MSVAMEDAEGTTRLADYAANTYSQFGEDGIIQKLFEQIGAKSKICVEFGAWDGFHMSNTANLWTQGWKGVLIEGHTKRFQQLVKNVASYNCVCIEAYVRKEGQNSLESILERERVGLEIDLLSIDIDGDDYYIFESLDRLRPRVVICEYNPTIPAHIELQAPYGNYFGSSVAAFSRLAKQKGYGLVALTTTNCFFVLQNDLAKLSGFETRLEKLRLDDCITYLITSHEGDYVISGSPPYGIAYPYRDPLIGTYRRMPYRSFLGGLAFSVWRRLSTAIKRMIGR